MDITVVVVTYNSGRHIEGFLNSLMLTYQRRLKFEVIVVDNGSDDGTLEQVRAEWSGIDAVQLGGNRGYAAGVNAGVAASRGSGPVLVANPDIRLRAGCVSALNDELCDPGVGIAVPRLTSPGGELMYSLRREPSVSRALVEAAVGGARAGRFGEVITDDDHYGEPVDVCWATGALMLVSRECLSMVGPWDESFFLYSEETDFALRARDHGYRTRFTPAAVAVHSGGESGTDPGLWSVLVRNRVELYRRRHGRLASSAFHLATFAGEVARAGVGRPVNRAGAQALLPSRRRSIPA